MFPSCLIQSIISELYSGLCKDVEQSESSNGFAHFKENLFAVNKEENSLQLKYKIVFNLYNNIMI